MMPFPKALVQSQMQMNMFIRFIPQDNNLYTMFDSYIK